MQKSYDDIIDLPHPVSRRHPSMPRADRAAQFAPFAALTGYDALIEETQRSKSPRRPRTEEENEALDQALAALRPLVAERPAVRMTCFVPTPGKEDGIYTTLSGNVRILDETLRAVTLTDGRRVDLNDIYGMEIENQRTW